MKQHTTLLKAVLDVACEGKCGGVQVVDIRKAADCFAINVLPCDGARVERVDTGIVCVAAKPQPPIEINLPALVAWKIK